MNYFKKRISAFGYAFTGIISAVKKEAHLKIHLLATVLVITAGFYFKVTPVEWMFLLGCCTLVISLEMVNSAIESVCNKISPEKSPDIRYIKDVSAGAVLVASIVAAITGGIIFFPHIKLLFS